MLSAEDHGLRSVEMILSGVLKGRLISITSSLESTRSKMGEILDKHLQVHPSKIETIIDELIKLNKVSPQS